MVSIISGGSDSIFYKAIIWLPCFLIPLTVFYASQFVKYYYKNSNQKWVKLVIQKKNQRKAILDNCAETDTYNDCVKIFKQFDPSRLNQFTGQTRHQRSTVNSRSSAFVSANNLTRRQPPKESDNSCKKYLDEKSRKHADEMAELMSKFAKARNNGVIGVPTVNHKLPSKVD